MIPYWSLSTFNLGPLTIHTWGFIVSIGFLAALLIAFRRARRLGLDVNAVLDFAFWILVAAFIGARLFHVFFYDWMYYSAHLREILMINQGGLSSFGGFIGAAVVFLVYGRYQLRHENTPSNSPSERGRNGTISSPANRFPPLPEGRLGGVGARGGSVSGIFKYADVLMFAWPLGHTIGRVGCFLTHMHPGRLSNVLWAVQYPGSARLDMGFIESILLLGYWVVIAVVSTRRGPSPRDGFYVVTGMLFYGVMRFILDFFRATDIPMADARFFNLTPAQYGSMALVVIGIYLWRKKFFLSR